MKRNYRQGLCEIFLALCLSARGISFAAAGDFSKDSIGTTGAQFLELPVGARGVAMGAAQGAAAEDATAIYYNPANLASLVGINIALMHSMYFQSISYDFLAVAIKTQNHGTIGFGAQYLSPGGIDTMDNTGNPTGDSLEPRDLALSAANARRYGALEYGFGVKYISSRLSKKAKTYAADGGIRWNLEPFLLSASLSNLGSGLKFREETSALPMALRVGSSYRLVPEISDKILVLALDGVLSRGAPLYGCAGIEYKIEFKDSIKTDIRVGYNSRTGANEAGGLTGFSAGVGVGFRWINFDYAFVPFGNLGNSHIISLALKFGNAASSEKKAGNRYQGSNHAESNFVPGSSAVVKARNATLYRYANTENSIISLPKDAEVEIVIQRGNWVKVNTDSGKTGWLQKSVLKPAI